MPPLPINSPAPSEPFPAPRSSTGAWHLGHQPSFLCTPALAAWGLANCRPFLPGQGCNGVQQSQYCWRLPAPPQEAQKDLTSLAAALCRAACWRAHLADSCKGHRSTSNHGCLAASRPALAILETGIPATRGRVHALDHSICCPRPGPRNSPSSWGPGRRHPPAHPHPPSSRPQSAPPGPYFRCGSKDQGSLLAGRSSRACALPCLACLLA